jgi:hypothetical protein
MMRPAILFTMTPKNDYCQIIREVVRGQRPCEDLRKVGIKIELIDGDWQIESPNLVPTELEISDIAHGLITYQTNPSNLKKWARLILLGSGFLDLSQCESKSGWEVLLNALWDATANGEISEIAKRVAQELAA